MSLSTSLRAALRRWYITIPGILLSLIVAGTVFNSMHPKYTSSGIAVLVRQNNPTTPNFVNPALGGDGTLTTLTLTLVQALDTPAVKSQLGLTEGVDNFTVNNVGDATAAAGADHPFLYIKTQSRNPQASTDIVGDVMNIARQKLADLQNNYHVRPQNQIKLESVVDATPPKPVMYTLFAVAGAVLALGLVATCLAACAWDGIIATRQKRRTDRSAFLANEDADSRIRAKTRKAS